MQKVKGKEHLEIREHWEIAFHIFLLNFNFESFEEHGYSASSKSLILYFSLEKHPVCTSPSQQNSIICIIL